MLSKTSRFWSVVALVLSSSLITPSWGRANERVSEFNIPPQALESALLVFAEQANVQVSVSTVVITGMQTQGVVGRFTPSVALTRLLTATGLGFSTVGDRTYSVSLVSNSKNTETGMLDADDRAIWADGIMRLAQTPGQSNRPNEAASRQTADSDQGETRPGTVIAEVLVTGTHIRGAAPVGSSLIVIDREDIDRTGFVTVQDLLQVLPQNFGGGANEDTAIGGGLPPNSSAASSINLRGLGPGATLVLLNGRRLAPAGTDASFVDVSSIPIAAVERIEVLPDGASAIYGSEAVGGVVNIVLRRDYAGAETRAHLALPTQGGARGIQASQILGTRWLGGNALLSYEYYEREALTSRDRDLSSSMDLRKYGGDDFRGTESNPGTIVVGSQFYAIPSGQNGQALDPATLVEGTRNFGDPKRDVLPDQKRHTVFAAANQAVGSRTRVFVDSLYSDRGAESTGAGFPIALVVPSTNPFYVDPTGAGGPIAVLYDMGRDLGPLITDIDVKTYNGAGGAEFEVLRSWRLTVQGSYARETIDQLSHNRPITSVLSVALADSNPATAFNPFGDGSFTNPATLTAIRGTATYESRSAVSSGTMLATGSLMSLAGGELALAFGFDYRRETFETEVQEAAGLDIFLANDADRNVSAAFGELRIPVVGAANARAGVQRLELAFAARSERYSDFGRRTTPKIGLAWSPIRDATLRGTWGRSFKAPTLPSLDEANNFILISNLLDPQSPTGRSRALRWFGQNADLSEETAETWSLGLDFSPSKLPGLKLDLTYFEIQFDDRVQAPPLVSTYLQDPSLADFVNRNPTAEQRAEICSRGRFIGNPADCLNAPIVAIVDQRVQNTALTLERGMDIAASYALESSLGQINFGLNATHLFELERQQRPSSPSFDVLDTPLNPIDFKLRGSLGWSRGGIGAVAYVNHVQSYDDTVSVPNRKIDSWTTLDLQLHYETSRRDTWLDGVSLALNVQNALDEDPPFFNNSGGIGYDPTNADLTGRVVSVQLRKSW